MNNLKILFTIMAFLAALTPAFSADEKEKTGYVRVDYSYNIPQLFFTDTGSWSYDLSITPENNSSVGVTVNYNGFVLGVSTDTLFGGESVLSDVFLTWFGEKMGVEAFYQSFSDYYISDDNMNKKYPGPNEYPDMKVMNNGLSFYYFFLENTYRNIYKQDLELLETGWSPFIKTCFSRFNIDNDESIIPVVDRPQFDADASTFNKYHSWQASLSAGISGTFSYECFYISGLISLGAGGEYDRYGSPGGSMQTDKNWQYDLDLQLAYGAISTEFFVGAMTINENQLGRIENLSIQINNLQASFFAGVFF